MTFAHGKGFRWRGLVAPLLAVLASPLAFAVEPEAVEPRMAELTAKLEEQSRKIEELEKRAAAAANQDVEAERNKALRAQIKAILSETEFRESLMPSTLLAGYDKGFYIKSSDNNFSFKVNGQLQFRWTHDGTRQNNRYLLPRLRRDDRTGFDITRLRFVFSGHAHDPNLTYFFAFSSDQSNAYDTRLLYGWVNYKFADEFQVKMGRFTVAAGRTRMGRDADQQFVDRSMTDAYYSLGDGTGVRFWGQCANKRVEWYVDVMNSTNGPDNRVITNDPSELDSNPAFIGRLVWHALGNDTSQYWFESDIDHLKDPYFGIGIHGAFNEDDGDRQTTRIAFNRSGLFGFFQPGGYGLAPLNGSRLWQAGADAVFKWNGFSLTGDYFLRFIDIRQAWDRPFAPLWRLTGEESTTNSMGGYVQAGYFLPIPNLEKKVEAVARIGGIRTNVGGGEGSWEYAVGMNYYIKGHWIKLQTDVTKFYEAPITDSDSSLANVNDDGLIWRVQMQVLF